MSTIRKYSAGRWFECRPAPNGVYYIHWSENRRSRRQSTRTTNLPAAQAFLDEWLKLYVAEAEDVTLEKHLTIADLWALKYPNDPERVRAAWKHLGPVFGALRPAEVTRALEAEYVESRPVAASTLRLELSLLRSAWNYGVKERLIPSTEVPRLDPLPAQSPPRSRWLKDAEMDRLFEVGRHHRRVWAFMWLARETAARRTAIQDLEWDQVDWETGMIHYLKEGQQQSRKRKASVPISDALRPVLKELHETRSPTDPYVIGRGARINEALARVADLAGVAGVTPHVFRHTKATRMARRGVPLFHIAGVLGNTVEQVEKVYAKHSPEALAAAVNEERQRRAG